MQTFFWIIYFLPVLAFVAAAIGAFLAYRSLTANHDWNRRQYALHMLAEWNPQTAHHRKAVENAIPGLIDIDKRTHEPVDLDRTRSTQIYCSKPGTPDWELRFHLVELGNHFEVIATAYLHNVGDRVILRRAFESTLTRWHGILEHLVEVFVENRGYKPWGPFDDLIEHWRNVPPPKLRKQTA